MGDCAHGHTPGTPRTPGKPGAPGLQGRRAVPCGPPQCNSGKMGRHKRELKRRFCKWWFSSGFRSRATHRQVLTTKAAFCRFLLLFVAFCCFLLLRELRPCNALGRAIHGNTSVGGTLENTFRTIGPYKFPQEKVWTNDWSIWISPEIRMDQWPSKFSESFSLDQHWSIECFVAYTPFCGMANS